MRRYYLSYAWFPLLLEGRLIDNVLLSRLLSGWVIPIGEVLVCVIF